MSLTQLVQISAQCASFDVQVMPSSVVVVIVVRKMGLLHLPLNRPARLQYHQPGRPAPQGEAVLINQFHALTKQEKIYRCNVKKNDNEAEEEKEHNLQHQPNQ